MNNHPTIGHVLGGPATRDAIHIAVAPVIAAEQLEPGDHIGFVGTDNEAVGEIRNPIGIVDPFLPRQVMPGERFYMFLYPQTVTNLRHDWTHPAFEPGARPKKAPHVQVSEDWLRAYALRYCPYEETEGKAFRTFIANVEEGDIFYHGMDLHSVEELKEKEELLMHLSNYLGRIVHAEDFRYGCSC